MRGFFSKIGKSVRSFTDMSVLRALTVLAVLALALNLILELLGRQSLSETFGFIISSPFLFLLNSLIILFTLSLCLLVGRRLPLLMLLSIMWLTLGIANTVVLTYRSYPLSAIDFLVIKATLGMATIYFTVIQLVAIGVLAAAFFAVIILIFVKIPRTHVPYRRSIACVLAIGLSLFAASTIVDANDNAVYETGELSDAYSDYGFAYCFTRSLLSQGVKRPDGYDPDNVDKLIEALESDDTDITKGDASTEAEPAVSPNIIFVQLESFFDINSVEWLQLSDTPTPIFNAIKESGVSGYLRVPHVGGGTANVEFEVLTGMNLDHFGFGEYPYTTILKQQACESIAQNLRALGYSAHAIHNHMATFYDRHIAYSNLGFDTFTPIEFMSGVTRNPLGWARDEILCNEIISALDSTDNTDFVFAVSVQGHGKYPSEPLDESSDEQSGYVNAISNAPESDNQIDVLNIDDPNIRSQYVYYINQLHEMDSFIGALIHALDERAEPYVAVFYGDHLPALPLNESDLASKDMYKTEYAVWTNTDILPPDRSNTFDRDLEAYQLSAYVLSLLDITEGEINSLHRHSFDERTSIDAELRMLEYVQLYDTADSEYFPTNLRLGICSLTIDSVIHTGNTLIVKGSGFNEYTEVKVDGIKRNFTIYDGQTLKVENIFFDIREVELFQVADDGTVLAKASYIH